MLSFDSLPLHKSTTALLAKHAIITPTPIQEELIPLVAEGRDVIAQSETGSGKTLGFALPLIEKINRRDGLAVLVLAPTRELALQISEEFVKFSHGKHLGITPVYGGVSINEQVRKLRQTNIIVGTPGRLLDLIQRGALTLGSIRHLVFDEADRMLDMGFLPDIERILHHVPKQRQTLLLSATLPKEIIRVSQRYLMNPRCIEFASAVKPEFLQQTYYQTRTDQKLSLLMHLLQAERDLSLVFCNRKHVTAKLARRLSSNGVHAKCLHGDMSQNQRERVTADFRQKKFKVLVATDVAARGLHIDDITHVYNYEIPRDVDSYTHRVGRTARAGKHGEAISLVATDEEKQFFKQILFTYSGRITLKPVVVANLPHLAEPAKPHTQVRNAPRAWSNHGRSSRTFRHRVRSV
jgi:ATP-dependent RNA helicase DeaD